MQQCRRFGSVICFVFLSAGIFFPVVGFADLRTVPELSLYLTHSSLLRSRFAANTTWSDDKSEFTNAGFEYDLDISLLSYFRRYVFKDPNVEKSKRVSFRLGYAYLPEITDGNKNVDEKRGLGEITFRFPLGSAWLLSDRNRGEIRSIGGNESGRYRNRLRLERNIAIKKFRMTPYANAEGYYDGKTDEWNQADATLGAEFPWRYQTILEFYFTWQFTHRISDNQLLGVTLQKHL